MSAEETLAALPLWPDRPRITPLAAGRTNRNYRVESGGRRFFARIGADIPEHGISRAAELRCASLAAQAGLAPEILYAGGGMMVTAFVEGETLTLDSVREERALTEIAHLLQRLHAIAPPEGVAVFSLGAAARRYLAALPDAALPCERARIAAALGESQEPRPRCLVHGDLIPENFICAADGLRLVDWEYAGGGVPETDLALVLSNFGLGQSEAESFLDAYGAADLPLVADLRRAAVIREALWCLVQQRRGGDAGDLPQYTALCLERLTQVLA